MKPRKQKHTRKPVLVPAGTLTKLNTCLDVLRQIAESKRGGLNKRLALSCLEFLDACDRDLAMKV